MIPDSTISLRPKLSSAIAQWRRAAWWSFLAVVIGFGWNQTTQKRPRFDERQHLEQITNFARGSWELYVRPGDDYPFLAMLPGYHVVVGAAVRVTGWWGLDGARWVNLLISLACYPFVRRWAAQAQPHYPDLRALQLFCFPLLYPFLFLVYTEALSFWLCLATAMLARNHRPVAAGIFSAAAVCVRQTNVIWAALVVLSALVERRPNLRSLLRDYWAFGLAFAAFATFVILHGRVPLNDPALYQSTLSLQNVAFAGGCGGLLFAPWLIAQVGTTRTFCRRRRVVAAAVVVGATLVCFYVTATDWRNEIEHSPILLRNYLLQWFLATGFGRAALAGLTSWFALSIVAAKWPPQILPLLIGSWLLGLVPLEFVEPRYYLTTFGLAVLCRPAGPLREEAICGLWWFAIGAALHWVQMNTQYFL